MQLKDFRGGGANFLSATGGAPAAYAGCEVWITNTKTGVSRSLTSRGGAAWGAEWSPNGKLLAFYWDGNGPLQVWIWDRDRDRLSPASSEHVHSGGFATIRWLPDNSGIIVTLPRAAPAAPSADARSNQSPTAAGDASDKPIVAVYESPIVPSAISPPHELTPAALRGDLALITLARGDVKRLLNDVMPFGVEVSPVGDAVACTTSSFQLGSSGASQAVYQLFVVNLNNGTSRLLRAGVAPGEMSWSKDGKMLAGWITLENPATRVAAVISAANGDLIASSELSVRSGGLSVPPLWAPTDNVAYFTGDGAVWKLSVSQRDSQRIATIPQRAINLIIGHDGHTQCRATVNTACLLVTAFDESTLKSSFYVIDQSTGTSSKILEDARTLSNVVPTATNSIFFSAESIKEAEDIWWIDVPSGRTARVTNLNPAISARSWGDRILVEWRAQDGAERRGWLLLPTNYVSGQRSPLIVFVYPERTVNSVSGRGG